MWLILPFLSGLLVWLSFPNYSFFPLAWVALIPYALFLLSKPPVWKLLAGHTLFSAIYFCGVLYWVPRVVALYGNFQWLAALGVFSLMILVPVLFLLPFTVLTRWFAGRSAKLALLAAPGFWMLTEYLRNYYPVEGFPWALLGYSQVPYTLFMQVADVGGVYLVSFIVVLCNCLLLWSMRSKTWKPLLALALLLSSVHLYGAYRLYVWSPSQTATARVALVQGNIGLSEDREHYAEKYFETLPDYYHSAVTQGAAWVIFPEAQNPYYFEDDFYYSSFWQRLAASSKVPLLFNSTTLEKGESVQYYNSAILLDSNGRPAFRYHKMHLVPFGEYVPLERWLTWLEPLVQEVSAFSAGKGFPVGRVDHLRFGTLICFEAIFPEISRTFVQQQAEILVNITNDSWYGRTGAPRQHLEIATVRAIENRKVLLRAANSGYSAVIDEKGRVLEELGLFEEGMIVREVNGNLYTSIYSYVGDRLNWALIAISFVLVLIVGKDRINDRRFAVKVRKYKKKSR
ncbi:MAG: apolipoprotein N-acyltransferase [Acidobacteria bacterium]|nr:apolipoprotein N-acyltransferase [Acidobacteriota bacterium]